MRIDDDEIARLLRLLRPAPAAWVEAAQELPFLLPSLDPLLQRARTDVAFRDALAADPQQVLREAGYDLAPDVVAHVLRRLQPPRPDR